MTCLCMERNNHQGWFGESFVNVLAAAAGLVCRAIVPDCTGVDFDISHPGEYAGESFPEIKVQVKTWVDPVTSREDPGCWRYPRLSQILFQEVRGSREFQTLGQFGCGHAERPICASLVVEGQALGLQDLQDALNASARRTG